MVWVYISYTCCVTVPIEECAEDNSLNFAWFGTNSYVGIPGQNIPCHFLTPIDKTSHKNLQPLDQTSHAVFVTPDKMSHAISTTADKTSHAISAALDKTTGGHQQNYREIALTLICSFVTSGTFRGSGIVRNAIPCRYDLPFQTGQMRC